MINFEDCEFNTNSFQNQEGTLILKDFVLP